MLFKRAHAVQNVAIMFFLICGAQILVTHASFPFGRLHIHVCVCVCAIANVCIIVVWCMHAGPLALKAPTKDKESAASAVESQVPKKPSGFKFAAPSLADDDDEGGSEDEDTSNIKQSRGIAQHIGSVGRKSYVEANLPKTVSNAKDKLHCFFCRRTPKDMRCMFMIIVHYAHVYRL